jgi:cytochrome P450
LSFGFDRLGFLERVTREFGDVVFFRVGPMPFAILNHPDYVRDVLVTRHRLFHKGVGLERAKLLLGEGLLTSEDDHHRRQRRILQPVFHRERIAAYATTMAEYAERVAERWQDGQTVEVSSEMARLALAIAGKTLFDADVEKDASTIGAALTDAIASFNLVLLPFGEQLARLPIPPTIRFRRAKATLDAAVYRMIADRRATDATGHDVLSTLVAARDEDDGRGMSDEEIRDEAMTLLLAGHETTANALTWSWYLLSQHSEVAVRLRQELRDVLGSRTPTVEDLPRLIYTRAVMAESMRLFPPAYILGRRAISPYQVPGTEYELPAGTVVLVAQYLLHRDARFWDAPEAFRPERWLESEPVRYAYFPFGAGPRVCIGEHFAWMEGTIALATIAQRWHLTLVPGQRVELEPIITLRSKHGMRMTVERA